MLVEAFRAFQVHHKYMKIDEVSSAAVDVVPSKLVIFIPAQDITKQEKT